MTRLLSVLLVLVLVGLNSCKKDPTDPAGCATNWAAEVEAEINALSAAATAYATDPTAETCNTYKTAYQNYIDALEPFLECATWTAQQKAELQDIIDEAEAEVGTLCEE